MPTPKSFAAALVLVGVSLPWEAMAARYAIQAGFDNYGVQIGGTSSTLPGGFAHIHERFGHVDLGQRLFAGRGASISGSLVAGSVDAGYRVHPGRGLFVKPEIGVGAVNVDPQGAYIRATYAYAGGKISYHLFRAIDLIARGAFGRDFHTAVTGVPTTLGGLYTSGSIGAAVRIGRGWATFGYEYQHMPFGGGGQGRSDLVFAASQFRAGYRLSF